MVPAGALPPGRSPSRPAAVFCPLTSRPGGLLHSPHGPEIVERCAGCRRSEPHAFCKLPGPSLRALEAVKHTTLFPRGALLFVEGQPGPADRLRLALTHGEIGQLICASRETVTRLFNEFKHENLIQVKGAFLQLNNRPALEALANY